MHNVKAIYIKELRSYFNSPMAYIFLVLFALGRRAPPAATESQRVEAPDG